MSQCMALDVDDSVLQNTEYLINDVVYPIDTSVCLKGTPNILRQICRNSTLFGARILDFGVEKAFHQRTIRTIPSVAGNAPESHIFMVPECQRVKEV